MCLETLHGLRPCLGSGLLPGSLFSLLWLLCPHLNTESEPGSSLIGSVPTSHLLNSLPLDIHQGLGPILMFLACPLSLEKAISFSSMSSTFPLSCATAVLCDSFLANSWCQVRQVRG